MEISTLEKRRELFWKLEELLEKKESGYTIAAVIDVYLELIDFKPNDLVINLKDLALISKTKTPNFFDAVEHELNYIDEKLKGINEQLVKIEVGSSELELRLELMERIQNFIKSRSSGFSIACLIELYQERIHLDENDGLALIRNHAYKKGKRSIKPLSIIEGLGTNLGLRYANENIKQFLKMKIPDLTARVKSSRESNKLKQELTEKHKEFRTCHYCQNQVDESEKICTFCGHDLNKEVDSLKLEDSERKKELEIKTRQFISLMKEISEEITDIVAENKESQYHNILTDMIGAMDKARLTIREAYYSFIAKNITDN